MQVFKKGMGQTIMQGMNYNYYIRVDENNNIIKFYNSVLEPVITGDILYQSSPERNLQLTLVNKYQLYLYKYEGGFIVEKTEEELGLLDTIRSIKINQLIDEAIKAIEVYYSRQKQANITNRVNHTDDEFYIMNEFISRILTYRDEQIEFVNNLNTTLEIETVSAACYSSIIPLTALNSSNISEEDINTFTGSTGIRKKIIITDEMVGNHYLSLTPVASGGTGERKNVQVYLNKVEQEYGVDYTAINDNNNEFLYIIWCATLTEISGITTLVKPTIGLCDFLEEEDIITVIY